MSRIHQTSSDAWGKPWASTAAVAVVVVALALAYKRLGVMATRPSS